MADQYDILIVGAGPAGCMLAREAGRTRRVLLVEARACRLPAGSGKGKNCGGLLNEEAQKALASFGIALPAKVLESPQVFAIRAIDFDNGLERFYPKKYINIDREAFDRFLLEGALARPGVELADRTVVRSIEPAGDHVTVQLKHEDGTATQVQAECLVGADGAASMVRRTLETRLSGPDEPAYPIRRYAALQQWFEVKEELPYYAAFFDQKVTDYYSWMIPKRGRLILGSALPEGEGARKRFERLKEEVIRAGFPIDSKPVAEAGCLMLRPYGPESVNLGKGRVFLTGEAAGLISPSSEEGISYAIRSGHALGMLLADAGPSQELRRAYEKVIRGMSLDLIVKNLKSKIMYQPLPRGLVFRTGALSIRRQ